MQIKSTTNNVNLAVQMKNIEAKKKENKEHNAVSADLPGKSKNALQILVGGASDVKISLDGTKLAALTADKTPSQKDLEKFADRDQEVAAKHAQRNELQSQLHDEGGLLSDGDKKNSNDQLDEINSWLDKNFSADHLMNKAKELGDFLKENNIDISAFRSYIPENEDTNSKSDMIDCMNGMLKDLKKAYTAYQSDVDKYKYAGQKKPLTAMPQRKHFLPRAHPQVQKTAVHTIPRKKMKL